MRRRIAVESFQDDLVGFGHDMDGAIGEIDNTLIVAESPRPVVGAGAGVPGVGAAGRIAALQRFDHRAVTDGAGETSVAHTE